MRKIIAYLFALQLLRSGNAIAQTVSPAPLNSAERLELEIFRLAAASPPPDTAYAKFAERSYQQVNEMYDLGLRAIKWQLMASNVLMILVVVVTLSGVVLSAYQLWVSGRLALRRTGEKGEANSALGIGTSTLEISTGKVSVQTATVGIVVLVISAALLLLFVREVYTIHPMAAPVAAEAPKR